MAPENPHILSELNIFSSVKINTKRQENDTIKLWVLVESFSNWR